jgi:hypothetical protein
MRSGNYSINTHLVMRVSGSLLINNARENIMRIEGGRW